MQSVSASDCVFADTSQQGCPGPRRVLQIERMQAKMSELAHNILAQPGSIACVLQQQCGDGRSALLEAAALLRSAGQVLITGMGASMYASIPMEYSLCRAGIDAVMVEAGELLHYRHPAYRDSVVVVVSRSGESVEITKLLALLKGRQPIIGVSNDPGSELSRSADVSLHIGSCPDEAVAIQTYTGTVLALHLLISAVTKSLDAARIDVETLQPHVLRLIHVALDHIDSWDGFLDAGSPVYLLARGPSYASALEGALLFNEIAKVPAIGMLAASFRHGPAEIVDEKFRGLIFAPQGSTRGLNLALAGDLARLGGSVRVIGGSEEVVPGVQWGDVGAVKESLVPLLEIIPVQIAALRLAQLRGVPEGTLRYTPQVARDE